MITEADCAWWPPLEGDLWNSDTMGMFAVAVYRVAGEAGQVLLRIRTRGRAAAKDDWMNREYTLEHVIFERRGSSSTRHITTAKGDNGRDHLKVFGVDYLWGAIRHRIICSSCGQAVRVDDVVDKLAAELRAKQLCFFCKGWLDRLAAPRDPLVAVVNGSWYTVDVNERGPSDCKGFGGSRWHIRWHDGRERVTTNLWHGGFVPAHLVDQFPDSAVFVGEVGERAFVSEVFVGEVST